MEMDLTEERDLREICEKLELSKKMIERITSLNNFVFCHRGTNETIIRVIQDEINGERKTNEDTLSQIFTKKRAKEVFDQINSELFVDHKNFDCWVKGYLEATLEDLDTPKEIRTFPCFDLAVEFLKTKPKMWYHVTTKKSALQISLWGVNTNTSKVWKYFSCGKGFYMSTDINNLYRETISNAILVFKPIEGNILFPTKKEWEKIVFQNRVSPDSHFEKIIKSYDAIVGKMEAGGEETSIEQICVISQKMARRLVPEMVIFIC